MTNDTVNRRIKLVQDAQEAVKKVSDEGLIGSHYLSVIKSALNTAMKKALDVLGAK
jgi:hypothetical protein